MKKMIALLLLAAGFVTTNACLNEKHVTIHGKHTIVEDGFPVFYKDQNKQWAEEFLGKFDLARVPAYTMEDQSDIAVNLTYLGRFDEALTILRRLQKKYPTDYDVTANLGTVYELVGKNDSALYFIKKAIEIDPESHSGSEWVHMKILEAKKKIAKDHNWALKNRIINTGITLSSPEDTKTFEKIRHIKYQLQERVPFTPMPDLIVANIFDELGDLCATQRSIEHAYLAYEFALRYYPSDPFQVKKKMEQLQPLLAKSKSGVPSWQKHLKSYATDGSASESTNNTSSQIQREIGAILTNKDKVADLLDEFGVRKKEPERSNKKLWIIGGILAFVPLCGVYIFWLNKKSKTAK